MKNIAQTVEFDDFKPVEIVNKCAFQEDANCPLWWPTKGVSSQVEGGVSVLDIPVYRGVYLQGSFSIRDLRPPQLRKELHTC